MKEHSSGTLKEESLEGSLSVAFHIRAVVDECLSRMSILPVNERNPDSPHLLTLFDLLASVINEETIVQATVFADNGFVKLYTSEPENAPSIITPNAIVSTSKLKNEENMSVVKKNTQQEQNLEEQGIAELNYLEVRKRSSFQPVAPSIEQKESVDIFEDEEYDQQNFLDIITDGDELEMPAVEMNIFDEDDHIAEGVVDLEELSSATEDELLPIDTFKGLRIYEVSGNTSQSNVYLLPDINYCTCERFQKDVLQKRSDFTCAHVLATWLSKALGLTKIIHTKREILTMMANHLVEKTEEFY